MAQLQFWTNISIIWLSFLCFVGAIIPLGIAFYAIRGMNVVLGKSRSVFQVGQFYSRQMRKQVDSASAIIVRPVVAVNREAAKVDAILKKLARDES